MNKSNKKHLITIETIIIIAIAGCMLFLNFFTSNKLEQLERAGDEALFIRQDLPYSEDKELSEEILQYRPDSFKMIEMYSEDFELLLSISFRDENTPDNDINNYPELINLLKSNQYGETVISIDGYEEAVHFQWVTNNRNEKRLMIIYSSKPEVANIWVFNLVCYIVIVLVFLLLIRMHIRRYHEKINEYKSKTDSIRDSFKL